LILTTTQSPKPSAAILRHTLQIKILTAAKPFMNIFLATTVLKIATFRYPAEMMEAHSIAKDFQKVVNPKDKYEYKELQEEMC